MIRHTPDTITLRQFSKFEKTKDQKYLLRVPALIWFVHNDKFITDFNNLFNPDKENETDNERLKLIAQNRIMLMQALLMGIQVHLFEKIQIEILKSGKVTAIPEDKTLAYYISEAEQLTGIPITDLQGVLDLKGELERRIDKYYEIFPEKKQETTGISIIQLAFSVFSILNLPINLDLTLTEFVELKQLAYERVRQQQETIEKYK